MINKIFIYVCAYNGIKNKKGLLLPAPIGVIAHLDENGPKPSGVPKLERVLETVGIIPRSVEILDATLTLVGPLSHPA